MGKTYAITYALRCFVVYQPLFSVSQRSGTCITELLYKVRPHRCAIWEL